MRARELPHQPGHAGIRTSGRAPWPPSSTTSSAPSGSAFPSSCSTRDPTGAPAPRRGWTGSSRALDEVARRTEGWRVQVALENTAGAGHVLGSRAEELGAIFSRVRRPERLALCLDTCHLFAAGYDIRTPRRFAAVLASSTARWGSSRLAAFHLNDSQAGLGSKLDRHENIGAGRIGLAAFQYLLEHPRLAMLPMILETPKRDDGDARNLADPPRLRRRPRPRR